MKRLFCCLLMLPALLLCLPALSETLSLDEMLSAEEAVMIDRQYSSIVNRSLGISTDVQRHRILLPDYFEYSME